MAVGLSGLLVAGGAAWVLHVREDRLIDVSVRGDAEQQVGAIGRELSERLAVFDALTAYYDGSEKVEPGEFAKFVARFLRRYPDILSLSTARRIPSAERPKFEAQMRKEQGGDHQIRVWDARGRLAPAGPADEYFPIEGAARRERLERVLAHLVARGWVEATDDGALRATTTGEPWLVFLRAQLQPLLEAYAAVARVVAEAKGQGERDALLERVQAVQKEALLVGEAHYPEGACPIAAANALEWLLREAVLIAHGKAEYAEAGFAPGPEFGALESLRARLATATSLR